MSSEISFSRTEISAYYALRVPELRHRQHARESRGPCPIHNGKDDNFSVNLLTGEWFCHSVCGRGGDIFALEAALTGTDFPTCKAEVLRLVGRIEPTHRRNGIDTHPRGRRDASPPRPTVAQEKARQPEQPVPAEAVRGALGRQGYRAVAEYKFGNALRKVKFEHRYKQQKDKKRPEKTFRWERLVDGIWYSGDGAIPKPLYVNKFFRECDQVEFALGLEGEAKAEVAGEFGLAAFSFKDITQEQAATLTGCDVVLWPDNDDSGRKQADGAARIIAQAGQTRSLKILVPPAEFPPAADIIDAVTEFGWDRQRVLQLVQTASLYLEPAPEHSSVPPEGTAGSAAGKQPSEYFPFRVSNNGVFYLKEEHDGSKVPIRLAARVDVMAKTRDAAGDNWGRLLCWQDHEGRQHQWAMPMETLATEQGAVRARLLSEGLPFITTNAHYRERFSEYLQTAPSERMVRCVATVGWHGDTYVLPDRAIGPEASPGVLYQPPHEGGHHWKVSGTFDEWRDDVGRRCSGNSRLILAVSAAFAGPILRLVGAESGGIHFHGLTSTGKSTALVVGGSVLGGGGKTGFVQTWRTTINGLEATAAAHNDGTMFLDELAQADPRDASEAAYLLGNGQGKSRMTRSIGARKRLAWTLLYVSAGELTLAEHSASAGKRVKGGAEVRLLNIEADAGRGLGLFETLHCAESPEIFVHQLRDAAQRYYGTPIRAFLERLVQDPSVAERRVRAVRDMFVGQSALAGEVHRAADRFALIGAAGELATQWSLTGWRPGEATEVAIRCFREWLGRRGTSGASDVEAGIRQVRAFIVANGASRFQPIRHPVRANDANDDVIVVRDRVGFRRYNSDTDETEYLILLDSFKDEVCKGQPYRAVLKELDKRRFLVREGENLTIKPRLPELGTPRVYCIRGAILEGDDAGHV